MTIQARAFHRRALLKSAALGATLAAAPSSLKLAFAAQGAAQGAADLLVVVQLRGGMDGLNLLAPIDDSALIAARVASVRIAASGADAGLAIANGPTAQDWRLHPKAGPLRDLYQGGLLAFVHASGLVANTRSHFQAIDLMERGITDPSLIGSAGGWLARHLSGRGAGPVAGIAASPLPPECYVGWNDAIAMPDPGKFQLRDATLAGPLRAAYGGGDGFAAGGLATLNALQTFAVARTATPTVHPDTSATATSYQTNEFTRGLDTVAQLIAMDAGVQVATVEFNNWDTHHDQAPVFARNVETLAGGLMAFVNTVQGSLSRLTVMVMSEFGRRVAGNANAGTDHGHGNVMMALGGNINGGRVYGRWPGLAPAQLDSGDLAITTDYRQVLAEVLAARRGEGNTPRIFPNWSAASPLGLARG